MDVALSADAALAAEIERLKAAHPKTRELYREVCALLFFRYGLTPTANRLYQLVHRGSMGTPTAVLGEFWSALREKSRVRIEHPDLPADLGAAAGELVATLWTRATASADAALDALRGEVEAQRVEAQQAVAAARDELGRVETALEQRTPMVVGQTQQPIGNLVVLGIAHPDVPVAGLADAERLTCQPNRYAPAGPRSLGHLAPARWPQSFFASASATISALSFSSTYILRSRAFSASSSFIRAISDTSMPPYFERHL